MLPLILQDSGLDRLWVAVAVTVLIVSPATAQVGDSALIRPAIPEGFQRDRNVAVSEQGGRDFAASGIAINAFTLYPSVRTAAGVTSNTYLTATDEVVSSFASIVPEAVLRSNWRRHYMAVTARGTLDRYIGESRRDQESWELNFEGQYDFHSRLTGYLEASMAQLAENRFAGSGTADAGTIANVRRDSAQIGLSYAYGRGRIYTTADRTDARFGPIVGRDGVVTDQSNRNRSVTRTTVQGEYALNPNVSLYTQFGYQWVDFTDQVGTLAAFGNSTGIRGLGGVSMDVPGLLRGTAGIGYTRRNYDVLRPVPGKQAFEGLAIDAQVDFFPSELVTVTVRGGRSISDSQFQNGDPLWDTRISLGADYQAGSNIIINGSASYFRQRFLGSGREGEGWGLLMGSRYYVNRRIELFGQAVYQRRTPNIAFNAGQFDELRSSIGIRWKI